MTVKLYANRETQKGNPVRSIYNQFTTAGTSGIIYPRGYIMNSGIYKITCTANGKFYIGRTKDIKHRANQHFTNLRRNVHNNGILQRCFNKYGAASIVIELIEPIADVKTQIIREQEYLDKYIGSDLCMNINKSAEVQCDVPYTEERRRKISASRKKQVGLQKRTAEQRKHISDALKGHVLSEETRRKISEAHKGKKLSEEHKAKVRAHVKRGPESHLYGIHGAAHRCSIPVWKVDPVTGEKLQRFESGVDAAKTFGANDGSNLRKALKKGIKAYGYLWVEDKRESTIESKEILERVE